MLPATSSPTGPSPCASPPSTSKGPDSASVLAGVLAPPRQAAMTSDVAKPLLGHLARGAGGHDQHVVALLQTCRPVGDERLGIADDQRHRGALGQAELADLHPRELR